MLHMFKIQSRDRRFYTRWLHRYKVVTLSAIKCRVEQVNCVHEI